jgi:hypothetical protein
MDLAFCAQYVTRSLWSGRVPIYSDLLSAWYASESFGGALPILEASIGVLLFISISVSGVLLLRGHRFGVRLVYAQFPFRFILYVPSLFFIPWLTQLMLPQVADLIGFVLIITTEILKIWSLQQWQAR